MLVFIGFIALPRQRGKKSHSIKPRCGNNLATLQTPFQLLQATQLTDGDNLCRLFLPAPLSYLDY